MKLLEIGCYPAPVTPFSEKGDFMVDAFAEILRWHVACGSKGFLIAGDNGENWALSNDELRQVTEVAMREAKGRPIYVGAWAITEREAIERAAAAAEGGAYGLCIKPQPYVHAFAKAPTAEVVGRFEAMAKAVPLPVMVYNSPNRNNVSITHEQLAGILDVCQAEALKDNNYDLQHQVENCMLFHDKINILATANLFRVTGMQLGARGVIGSPYEYFGNPDRIFEWDTMSQDERRDMMRISIEHKEVNSYLGAVPASYKAGLNMIGLPAGYTRDPIKPLTAEEEAKLRAFLVKWGAPVTDAAAHAAE